MESKFTFLKQCLDSVTPLKSPSPPPSYLWNKVQTSSWPLPPGTVLTCKFCPPPLLYTRPHSILTVSWIGLSSFLYCAWFTLQQPEILHFSHSPLKAHFWVRSTQWGGSLSSFRPTPPRSASSLAWHRSGFLVKGWLCLPCCCLPLAMSNTGQIWMTQDPRKVPGPSQDLNKFLLILLNKFKISGLVNLGLPTFSLRPGAFLLHQVRKSI